MCVSASTALPQKTMTRARRRQVVGTVKHQDQALVHALGNPLNFFLTGGAADDLVGADHPSPTVQTSIVIADEAFDADQRVLEPLAATGKAAVVPTNANQSVPRPLGRRIYGVHHLIGNFFAQIKQFYPITTRHDKAACDFLAAVHCVTGVSWLD